MGFRAPLREWPIRAYANSAAMSYLTSIAVSWALVLALPVELSLAAGMSVGAVWILSLLGAIPASDLAIAIVQRAVSEVLGPRPLPRLDLSRGVPSHLRAIVVMPTLLTARAAIEEQVERLGVHYLANADDELRFALLSDWADAPTESTPTDEDLLARRAQIPLVGQANCAIGPRAWKVEIRARRRNGAASLAGRSRRFAAAER